MSKYLMIDFGSTFTKLTAVDSEIEDIIETSLSPTTVKDDIFIGYNNALNKLKTKKFDKIIACSSAAGGLKMCAIGLIKELTVEAARRVCLGAGAKVELTYSSHLTSLEIEEIKNSNIDIILLAGGTDGGNSECVIHNALKLGKAGIKIPLIFAGNKCATDEVLKIFKKYNLNGYTTNNIMPRINVLDIDKPKNLIKEIFLSKIIEARGIKKIEETIDKVILPTPVSVMEASLLLSKGYMHEKGLGELIVVDVGGATTDFYSMSSSSAKRSDVVIKGLEEPYSKRTVEGDLGMRYSAIGVSLSLTDEEKKLIEVETGINISEEALKRSKNVSTIYEDEEVDTLLASICVDKATSRHVGTMETVYTPMGVCYNQIGKDLSLVRYVIGSGGILVNSKNPLKILSKVLVKKELLLELRPQHPEFLLDKDYILQAMGLLSTIDPLLALKIMKKRIIKI